MRAALLPLLAACSFQHGQLPGELPDGDIARPDGSVTGFDAPPHDGRTPDGPMPPSPLRQKTITINLVAEGPHQDFPLWVSLTDPDIAARALADGSDIHFVEGSTPLDYEIQRWDKSSGKLEAWVRVPMLQIGTEIAVRYGDAPRAHPPNPSNTFAGYLAVWHLDDPLTNNTVQDARGMRNGTAQDLGTNASVPGVLGRGIDFNDGDNQRITFVNPLTGNRPHTISLWVNQRTTTNNDAMVVLGNGTTNQARWFHSYFDGDTIAVGFYSNDLVPGNNNTGIVGDGWVLLHWVYEGGGQRRSRLYRGGSQVATGQHNNGTPNTQGTDGFLGNAPGAFGQKMGLHATLDEVRIIDVVRSPGWIATEAANQSNPSTFYTVSPEQMP